MQGHRSSLSALPENLSFDHSSSSSEAGVDSQMSWNSMQTSAQNRLPECTISSNETNLQYLHHVRRERQNAEWCLGEGSSSAAPYQRDHSERKAEHPWSFSSRAPLTMQERSYGSSNILSLDSSSGNQTVNGSFHLQDSSSSPLPQDLNISSGFADLEDDDCQIVERPIPYTHVGPSNQQMLSSVNSSASFGLPMARVGYVPERDDRPGSSVDGRRVSCKRKSIEIHPGQSSGTGNLNIFQSADRNQWHTLPTVPIAASNINMSTQAESNLVINNGLEPANPRLRLGVGGAVSANPFTLTASGAAESSRRNFRLRINGSTQQDPLAASTFSADADIGSRDITSSRHSARLALHNRLFELNPRPVVENGVPQVQYVPALSQTPQTRWSGASTSRSSRSSASPIPGQRNASFYAEPTLRNVPGSISEHPLFVPLNETRSPSQHPTNWHLGGGNNNVMGNNASSSRSGSVSRVNSSAPTWSRRSCPQYPRRLSEVVRRSLLSSAGTEAGGQSSNNVVRPSSAVAPPAMAFSSASDNHGRQAPNSRSALLERHLEGVFGTPYSLRTLAAASEGRSSRMSEIRHVLDLMRRGEGLRLEDVMILDHSVLFGMADIHDRHRDMRLDVDNMSYEELLALEERIGNVCTGLSEETILNRLKQHKYVDIRAGDQMETEPCSICREEYNDGEDLGRLECGHDFHRDCVTQWLLQKNLCPICKKTGLTT